MGQARQRFRISRRSASQAVGDDVVNKQSAVLGKADRLQQWLYRQGAKPLSFRLAPSIITRSEAELLGVSSPRFAVRVYLTDESFVNARRRQRLARAVESVHAQIPPTLLDEISKDSWIADSLLTPPEDLRRAGYRFLTTKLGLAYGERSNTEGVPFVTHMRFGGGLCAQAACFMVLAILSDRAFPIYGVAEITARAQDGQNDLDVNGMSGESIAYFFRDRVEKVTAQVQGFSKLGAPERQLLPIGFQSYLASGCPIILLVSLSRMFGDHHLHQEVCDPVIIESYPDVDFNTRQRIPIRRKNPPQSTADEEKQPHAVVLVGWHPRSDQFIVNDPATYPFLPATAEQIVDIRRYKESAQDGRLRAQDVGPLECIPVTPAGVKLTLFNVIISDSPDGSKREVTGLLQGAETLQAGWGGGNPAMLRYHGATYAPGEFRLVRWRRQGPPQPLLSQPVELALRNSLTPGWYWYQHIRIPDVKQQTRESIWLWDASQPPTSNLSRYLRAVLGLSAETGQWQRLDFLSQEQQSG